MYIGIPRVSTGCTVHLGGLSGKLWRQTTAILWLSPRTVVRASLPDLRQAGHHSRGGCAYWCWRYFTKNIFVMQRMNILAPSYVWWPLRDQDFKATVRQCRVCQTILPAKTPGPLHTWTCPTPVGHRVHDDFAVKDGTCCFVLVSSYSKGI